MSSCLLEWEAGRHYQEPETGCSFFLYKRPQHIPEQLAEIWHILWVFIYWSYKTCALTAYLLTVLMVVMFFCISALLDNLKTYNSIFKWFVKQHHKSAERRLKWKSRLLLNATVKYIIIKLEVVIYIIIRDEFHCGSLRALSLFHSVFQHGLESSNFPSMLWKCVCLYHCQWLLAKITCSTFLSCLQIFGTVWEERTFCGFVSFLPPRILVAKTYLWLFNTSVNIQYNYHMYSWLIWQ